MKIEPFQREDVGRFMALAAAEGWVVEEWEFDFLRQAFPQGCFCARDKAGRTVGFVTSLAHDQSGWIGNLIVRPGSRGSGIGRSLFLRAVEVLFGSGARTIWLTASKAGRPLYEKQGFNAIDSIVRWTGTGNGSAPAEGGSAGVPDPSLDRLGWGDDRQGLLAAVALRGRSLARDGGFAVIQPCNRSLQIGPFAALDGVCAEELLDGARASIPAAIEIYIDAPSGNAAGTELLQRRGFRRQGSNELMFAGLRPDYRPEYIYGLASMGSMG